MRGRGEDSRKKAFGANCPPASGRGKVCEGRRLDPLRLTQRRRRASIIRDFFVFTLPAREVREQPGQSVLSHDTEKNMFTSST